MSAVFFFYRQLCLSVDQFPSVELKKGRSPGEEAKEAACNIKVRMEVENRVRR